MENVLRRNLDPHALARQLSGKRLIGGAMVPAVTGKPLRRVVAGESTIAG